MYTAAPTVEFSMSSVPEFSGAVTLARIVLVDLSGGDLRAKAHFASNRSDAKERRFTWAHLAHRFLFAGWALAGIFTTSRLSRHAAFCASLTFRWTSYSLSRTGDRSGEEEGSCAVFFFDFGLRAVALPLAPAGAIVGDRLLEWKFKEGDRFNQWF